MTGSVLFLEFRCRINQEILVLTFSDLETPTMAPFKSSKLYPFDCCLYLFFHPQVARFFFSLPQLPTGHGSEFDGPWCGQSAFILFRMFANLHDFLFQSLGMAGLHEKIVWHQFERWGTATNESRSRSSIEVEVNMSLSLSKWRFHLPQRN